MKKNTTIVLLVLLSFGCSENQTSNNNMSEANIKIVQEVFEHFNNHNWEAMANLYIENAEFKDPEYGIEKVKRTRAETVEHYNGLNQMFADIHDEVIAIYPSGDKHIIVEFVSSGTAPDGTTFTLPICTIFTIEGGMITKDHNYYDNF